MTVPTARSPGRTHVRDWTAPPRVALSSGAARLFLNSDISGAPPPPIQPRLRLGRRRLLQTSRPPQLGRLVRLLPCEVVVLPAEVAVGRSLLVDRTVQVEVVAEGARSQVEVVIYELNDLGARDLLVAEGLDHDRNGVGDPDRVRHLVLAAADKSGGNHVLGDVARGVGGRAVDLRGVLAGEGAAAVAGHAAVGIDDDLAPGQAGVAYWAADDEAPGRVDEEVLAQLLRVVELLRQDRLDDVLPEIVRDERLGALLVLGRDEELLDLDRAAVLIADRDLRLAVGAEVVDRLGLADRGQALGKLVRK